MVVSAEPQRGARGDPETMREVNRTLVAEALRAHGPLSRAQLSRRTSISAPTVSAIVAELMAGGLVEEVGTAAAGLGRPPRLVAFSGNVVFVGCDLSTGHAARIGLLSLAGRLSHVQVRPLPANVVGEDIARMLAEYMRGVLQQDGLRIGGIGVAVPGVCDTASGSVRRASTLGWADVALGPALGGALGLPVRIDNDVNLALLGEVAQGAAASARNAIMISMSDGVGGAVLIDGRLYRGRGAAGEIGFSVVADPSGGADLREYGALERWVFELLAEVVDLDPSERDELDRRTATLAARLTDGRRRLDLPPTALESLTRTLARALAGAIGLLDPDVVVLRGWVTPLGKPFLDGLRSELERLLPDVPPLRLSSLRDAGVLTGAALSVSPFALGATRIQASS